jgi:hypothetical protein
MELLFSRSKVMKTQSPDQTLESNVCDPDLATASGE